MMKKFVLLLSLLYCLTAFSQDIKKLLESDDIILTIKPHICIAPRGEKSCISHIDISWRSIQKGNYCLDSSHSSTILKCWENADSGLYQHKLIFSQDVVYMIENAETHDYLVNSVLKFKLLKPHRKYKKRHNRFPWSIGSL